jgi:hypothetical protein
MEIEIVQDNTGTDMEAQISTPRGWLYTLVGFILGPVNRSNPIWLLRLLSLFCLVVAVNGSALLLPDYLRAVHSTYQVSVCLPLKIRGIEKATWDKRLKIQGEILKARRDLIQVQKHHEKRRIQ